MIKTRLCVVSRQPMAVEALAQLIDSQRFDVVSASLPDTRLLEAVRQSQPKVLVVDSDGSNHARARMVELKRTCPDVRLAVLLEQVDPGQVASFLNAGIGGIIMKNTSAENLNIALKMLAAGEDVFIGQLSGLCQRMRPRCQGAAEAGLTPREEEILSQLACGRSNKEIARELDVTEGTVKVHIKSVLKKLTLQNRTQAAIFAYENGYFSAESA